MSAPSLHRDQVRRYARHIVLPEVGGVGQRRLLAASVAVPVGPGRDPEIAALAYLAAAGIGRLVLTGQPHGPVSDGEIDSGILYGRVDRGRPRIDAIAERVRDINPDVEVVAENPAAPSRHQRTLAPAPVAPASARSAARPGDRPAPAAAAAPLDAALAAARPEDSVADALLFGGLRAARTLSEIVAHESA